MQRKEIANWARANNLVITDWLVLKKSAQKIIDEVIQKTKEVKAKYLVCWRIDRVLRTGLPGLNRLLNGIHPTILISTSEGCNSRQHLETIKELCLYGSEEARSISKRTKLAMTLVRGPVGRAKIGWYYKNGRLLKEKRTQNAIAKAKQLARKGLSLEKISSRLNRGRKGPWTAQRIWACLNPPDKRRAKSH
jgi:hypothetical protein